MMIIYFKDFMKKYNLKDDTMNESQLQKIYKYSTFPRDSKRHSDKGLVNIDNGYRGGTHWVGFKLEDNKSYYFDRFGGQPEKFLLKQSPKPIIYHNYKIQYINFKFCGSYGLYLFFLIETMNYFDTFLKLYFG